MYRDPSTWQSSFRPPPVTCQAWMTGLLVLWHLPKTLLGSACSNNQSLNSLLMLTAATLSLLRLGVTSSAAATAWELLDLPWQINRSVYTAGGSLSLSVGLGSLPSVGWWLWGSSFLYKPIWDHHNWTLRNHSKKHLWPAELRLKSPFSDMWMCGP